MGAQCRLEHAHPLTTTQMSVEHVLQPGSPRDRPWSPIGRERGNQHPFALSGVHGQAYPHARSHPQLAAECRRDGTNDSEAHKSDAAVKPDFDVYVILGGVSQLYV